MVRLRVAETGLVGAPAELVYGLIADMKEHHARFLPPALKDLRVEQGGYGAGTRYRVTGVFLGGERGSTCASTSRSRDGCSPNRTSTRHS